MICQPSIETLKSHVWTQNFLSAIPISAKTSEVRIANMHDIVFCKERKIIITCIISSCGSFPAKVGNSTRKIAVDELNGNSAIVCFKQDGVNIVRTYIINIVCRGFSKWKLHWKYPLFLAANLYPIPNWRPKTWLFEVLHKKRKIEKINRCFMLKLILRISIVKNG